MFRPRTSYTFIRLLSIPPSSSDGRGRRHADAAASLQHDAPRHFVERNDLEVMDKGRQEIPDGGANSGRREDNGREPLVNEFFQFGAERFDGVLKLPGRQVDVGGIGPKDDVLV